ncbi:diacylglycerol kinase [Pseudomonas sp. gcc21]|nr:diacylglycerol kinase [Pseudomonas sp. gcc21]
MTDPALRTVPIRPSPCPTLTGQEPFFMVMNSRSGKGNADQIRETVEALLSAAGRRYELIPVSSGSQLGPAAQKALAKAREHDGIVVAIGGDGTLNAVARVVLGSGVPFGILPQGTFNYFGRCHGIPQDTEAAVQCLLDARVRPVSVGMLNDQLFLINASLGLYPRLLQDRERYKRRYGRSRLVALWSALATLAHAHRQLDVQLEYEGAIHSLRTPTIVVGNNRLQMEHIGIEEAEASEHNRLVLMSSRPVGTLSLYWLLVRGLASRLGDAENVISFAFDSMVVRPGRGRRKVKVALDGEITRMVAPLTFRVANDKLPLLVPRVTVEATP